MGVRQGDYAWVNTQADEKVSAGHPGALFISAYQGSTPDAAFLRFYRESSPAGVIVFADNCEDVVALRESIAQLQELSDGLALVAVDQEGGKILRLKREALMYPSAAEYGRQAACESLEVALEQYRSDLTRVSEGLIELGINLLLGPVCDLAPQSEKSALTGRAFSSDPEIVAAFVKCAVETQRSCGLLSCLKHAPGLGRVRVDPHLELGASEMTFDAFDSVEALPFRAGLLAGAEMIMSSHFLLPEGGRLPVTFSHELVRKFIREGLNSEVPLITDDLQMGALEQFGADGARAALAITAGHDIALTRNAQAAVDGIAAVENALADGSLGLKRYQEAQGRVSKLRSRISK